MTKVNEAEVVGNGKKAYCSDGCVIERLQVGCIDVGRQRNHTGRTVFSVVGGERRSKLIASK